MPGDGKRTKTNWPTHNYVFSCYLVPTSLPVRGLTSLWPIAHLEARENVLPPSSFHSLVRGKTREHSSETWSMCSLRVEAFPSFLGCSRFFFSDQFLFFRKFMFPPDILKNRFTEIPDFKCTWGDVQRTKTQKTFWWNIPEEFIKRTVDRCMSE